MGWPKHFVQNLVNGKLNRVKIKNDYAWTIGTKIRATLSEFNFFSCDAIRGGG